MSSNEGANNDQEQERAVAALCHIELEGPSELISQVILINPLLDSNLILIFSVIWSLTVSRYYSASYLMS